MITDMTWLKTWWEPPATKSGHVTHFKSPQRLSTVPSNNKILQCNKMTVQAKHSDSTKVQQIRKQYRGPVHSTNDSKKLKSTVPFVTKVQIKKWTGHLKNRPTVLKREIEMRQIFDRESEKESDSDRGHKNCKKNEDNQQEEYQDNDNEIKSPFVTVKLKRSPRMRRACYSGLVPVEQTEPEEHESIHELIKTLTRKLNDRNLVSLGAKTRTIPVAAFARPTKGEIALSKKGPKQVAVATANEAKKMHSVSNMPSLQIRGASSNHDSLSRDTILRGSSACSVPGPVSPRTTPRVSCSAPERISSLSHFDHRKRLCYCCRKAPCVQVSEGGRRRHDRQRGTRENSQTVAVRMPVGELQPYDQSDDCSSVESFSEASLEFDSWKEVCFTSTPEPFSSPVQDGDI